MRLRLKLLLITGLSIFSLGLAMAPSQTVSASLFDGAKNAACNGVTLDGTSAGCPNSSGGVNHVLSVALNLFSLVVGVIAILMIIIGGVKYITSQGESAQVTSAKDTIIYAVIGLVIVAFAQIIVRFVLAKTKA